MGVLFKLRRQGEVEAVGQVGHGAGRPEPSAGRRFTIRRQFVENLRETRMKATVGELDRALLLFHAPMDAIVGIDNAARIYEWARHPKSFVSLAGADHLLSDEADSNYVGRMLATWAGRYL